MKGVLTGRGAWMFGVAAIALGGCGAALAQAGASASSAPNGEALYAQHCAMCHGDSLQGQLGPTLNDVAFKRRWDGKAQALFDYISTMMPPGSGGSLTPQEYAAVTRMILAKNGIEGSVAADSNGAAAAPPAARPAPRDEPGVGGLSTRLYPLPPGPKIPDRFANFKPVTEAELDNPDPADWPAWRRSHLGLGYSPLKQIDTSNVGKLTIAWAQALPPGVDMNEPLVRDGVLYVFGFGDNVFAFDAASGRQLWRYQRKVPQGTGLNSRKTIALYGD
jgi:alcohol dehydrogenase (cytochrome c)